MGLHLVEITPENWRQYTRLKVAAAQRHFVADNALMLARAYVYRDEGGRAWGICVGGEPVGLLVQREVPTEGGPVCILDQMMIAEGHQRRGHGTEALRLWLEGLRAQRRYVAVSLCYIDGDDAALRLYRRFGFVRDGHDFENELGLTLTLAAPTPA